MFDKKTVEREIGGQTYSLATGQIARQAGGAVMVQVADTVVLVCATDGGPRDALDFFPLTMDYREKTASAGKIPGGFFKREGRPNNKEILTMRMMDRPIRPLFPDGFKSDIQVMASVLSADTENDSDLLAIHGAGAVGRRQATGAQFAEDRHRRRFWEGRQEPHPPHRVETPVRTGV